MQELRSIPGLDGQPFHVAGAPSSLSRAQAAQYQRKAAEAVRCPRCESTNTKFCYYNNYNLSQPRHFCRACRRYWTMGGALRNIPVGGGCRRAKRSSSTDAKNPRSNSGSTTMTTATATAPATPSSNSNTAVHVAPPAPIFADQAAVLASLFPPPPLPLFSLTAMDKVAASAQLAESNPPT